MALDRDPQTVLQRVLLLERQQGFQNRAAVGGLSEFARRQAERASLPSENLRSAVELLASYDSSDRRARESAVTSALRKLLGGSVAPQPASAREHAVLPSVAQRPAPAVRRRAPPRPAHHKPDDLEQPVTELKGIGKSAARALANVGVHTMRDLLFYFPRTHYDYTDTRSVSRMRLGQPMTLVGTIKDVRNIRTRTGLVITTAAIADQSGTVGVRWFNQPYLAQKLPVGAKIAITGEPEVHNGYFTFKPRDWELIEVGDLTHTGRLVPIYPLTAGLYQRSLRNLIRTTVEEYTSAVDDFLPEDLQQDLGIPLLAEAVAHYHFPDGEADRARSEQRLAFDELLMVQLGLLMRKREWQQPLPSVAIQIDEGLLERFCRSLPFALTGAQRRVLAEILEDLERPFPMSRLLEGDVGSGKTVVAAAALLQVAHSGKQGVLMAPTEVLAEQHARTLGALLEPFGVQVGLLIGSTKGTGRRRVYESVADGTLQVLVGTHALIQEGVEFRDLALAITDEQHRFGVEQRATLRQKGLHPHVLAMTATPIPRTLAMTIYGDLDVSVLDEMPPGRLPPITTWSRTAPEAYGVVRDEVEKGRQAFVICPVIEESEESDMRSVIAEHKELQSVVFRDLKVGLLHGRLKSREKDAVLEAFRSGDYQVLVATSVVEVGIDVPNATVMVIRDAHRFGLAQLHQFRGRVGRGGDQAYCVLLSDSEGDEATERLEAITATENGFELAEADLRLRGPGEFWGTRQSGLPQLRVARLGDLPTIQLARRAATSLIERDADLVQPEHARIRAEVERFWQSTADLS